MSRACRFLLAVRPASMVAWAILLTLIGGAASAAPVQVRLVAGAGSGIFPVQVFLSMAPGDSASFVQVAIEWDDPFVTFCCGSVGQAASPSHSTLTIDPSPALAAACDNGGRVVVGSIGGNLFSGSDQEVLQFYFDTARAGCGDTPLRMRLSCACQGSNGPRWLVRGVNPPHDYCFGDEDMEAVDGIWARPACPVGVQVHSWGLVKARYK